MPMRRPPKAPIRNRYHARQQCARVLHAAEESGLPLFADYGTLLGLVRHGDILAHDTDLDFSLLVEGRSVLAMPQWHDFLARIQKGGMFVRQHRSRGAYVIGLGGGITADLFLWYPDEAADGRWVRREYRTIDEKHGKGRYLWTRDVEGRATVRVKGRGWQVATVPIPSGFTEILSHRYGAGWLTPKAHHPGLEPEPWTAPDVLGHIDPPFTVWKPEDPSPAEAPPGPQTRAEYMEALAARGVVYPPKARLAELQALYEAS